MIKVIVLGTDPSSNLGGISFALQGYLAALEKSGLSADVIPTHRWQEAGGKYRLWFRAVPRVVNAIRSAIHEGDTPVVYCHAGAAPSLVRKFILLAICKMFGARTALQLHAIEVDGYLSKWWTRSLFKCGMLNVDLLCALTEWWKKRLTSKGIRTPIAIIPNPLPASWESCALNNVHRKDHGNRLVVCSISRLEAGKGVDLVIEAMRLLPSTVQLFIGGDGSQMRWLKDRVTEMHLSHQVHFMGWLNPEEKQALIRRADVFCLPTSYDSFGMGFMEAMANGLPIVALNYGPVADVVPDGRVGVLVERASPECVAEGIESLMDARRRREMSLECQKWVLSQFSSQQIGIRLRRSFEALVQGNGE